MLMIRKPVLRSLLLVSAMMMLTVNAYADSEQGQIVVTLDSELQSVEGLSVNVLSWHDSAYRGEGNGDLTGTVTFTGVPVGTVDVFAFDLSGVVLGKAQTNITADEQAELLLKPGNSK